MKAMTPHFIVANDTSIANCTPFWILSMREAGSGTYPRYLRNANIDQPDEEQPDSENE